MTLSFINCSNYYLTENGRVFQNNTKAEILPDSEHRLYMLKDNGEPIKISLKAIYRKIYGKEFCIDTIQNKPFEQWKEIEHTSGKYFISNYGRVKSYCRYSATVLKQYKTNSGYLVVKINRKNVLIHRLVALSFCENNYKNQPIEVHHKDGNRHNNNADNLQILSIKEHHDLHNQEGTNYGK